MKDLTNYLNRIQKETEDKSFLFAGFFPKAFYELLKKYWLNSYKEDLHGIRFELLEMNCKIFEWYVNTNNWLYKLSNSTTHRKLNAKKCKVSLIQVEERKNLAEEKRKLENVHTIHQDRKKKYKSS